LQKVLNKRVELFVGQCELKKHFIVRFPPRFSCFTSMNG